MNVFFHERLSSIRGCLPLQVVFQIIQPLFFLFAGILKGVLILLHYFRLFSFRFQLFLCYSRGLTVVGVAFVPFFILRAPLILLTSLDTLDIIFALIIFFKTPLSNFCGFHLFFILFPKCLNILLLLLCSPLFIFISSLICSLSLPSFLFSFSVSGS